MLQLVCHFPLERILFQQLLDLLGLPCDKLSLVMTVLLTPYRNVVLLLQLINEVDLLALALDLPNDL